MAGTDLTGSDLQALLKQVTQTQEGPGSGEGLTSTNWVWHAANSISGASPHIAITASDQTSSVKGGRVGPKWVFKVLKSKLTFLEVSRLKQRLRKLEQLADEYGGLGQEALSEACIKQFLILSREAAMWACGVRRALTEEEVNRYKEKVSTPLLMTPIKNFARPIPAAIAKKI